MRGASGIFGLVGIVFLFLLFIVAIVFVPVIFGAAENDLNMTANSTNYNETKDINQIVLVGVEVSPVLFFIIGVCIVLIIVFVLLLFMRR